jgi:hypothetical protein
MRYKIFSEIENDHPWGAAAFYSITLDQRLFRVKMSDLSDDVRLNNIYKDSKVTSVADFILLIAQEIPRNYGAKSHLLLLLGIESFLGKSTGEAIPPKQPQHREFSHIDKEFPKGARVFYAEEIDPRLKNLQMEEVVDDVRINNVYRASGANSLGDFVQLASRQIPANYGRRSHRLLLEMLERLPGYDSKQEVQCSKQVSVDSTTSKWRKWWGIIEKAGLMDFPIGKVAARNGIDWPTNRMRVSISTYRTDRPSDLLGKARLGKKRVQAIMDCVRALAEKGFETNQALPMTCKEAAKAAHIEEDHFEILELRFLKGQLRTLDSCGKILKLTRERVRQVEKGCIEKIRIAGYRDNLRVWLRANSNNIWNLLSDDDGMTVNGGISDNGLNNRLPGEYQLALSIADMYASEILDEVGDRIDDWWAKR